jgi:hypothetical protein
VKENQASFLTMLAILHAFATFILDLFKSRRRLQAENLFLRHQLNIALRRASPRLRLHAADRALLVWMARVFPELLSLAKVVRELCGILGDEVDQAAW